MVLLDNGGAAPEAVFIGPPPPDLHRLVEHLAIRTYPPHARDWRIVPDLSPHLIVSIVNDGKGRSAQACVVGARSRAAVVDVSRRVLTAAIRLRPGALPLLLRVPAADLTDRSVPLAHAFASHVLRDGEIGADTPPALLLRELLRLVQRAARGSTPDPIGRALERACRVGAMAEALGVAERTMRDRVIRTIGLPPKRALSIARLHRALFGVRGGRQSWAAVAHAAGYADQAHLARDCRDLLGDSPSAWLARGSADSFKIGAIRTR